MTDKDSYATLIADMRLAAKAERERRYDMDPQITDADADEWASRLAALSQPGEVTEGMVYAFHNALGDGSLGAQDFEDIKTGLAAALAASGQQTGGGARNDSCLDS